MDGLNEVILPLIQIGEIGPPLIISTRSTGCINSALYVYTRVECSSSRARDDGELFITWTWLQMVTIYTRPRLTILYVYVYIIRPNLPPIYFH